MSDGGSTLKQFGGEVKQAAGEVAKEVKDELGQALEQGVQSVAGTQLTPQQIQSFDSAQDRQKQQAEDQKKIAETRRKIAFYQQTAEEQKMVRQENKQKEQQRLQSEQQEKQVAEMKKEEKKGRPVNPAIAYAGKAEFKRGVGG